MTTKTLTIPVPSRRVVVLVLLAVLAVVAANFAMRMADTVNDARRCADGGCEDELPGRWSDGERTLTLDADGTFVARADGQTTRGTWVAIDRRLCFASADERECPDYQYMGDTLVLDGAAYERR